MRVAAPVMLAVLVGVLTACAETTGSRPDTSGAASDPTDGSSELSSVPPPTIASQTPTPPKYPTDVPTPTTLTGTLQQSGSDWLLSADGTDWLLLGTTPEQTAEHEPGDSVVVRGTPVPPVGDAEPTTLRLRVTSIRAG